MEITDANIAGLMAEGKPMILDFWATCPVSTASATSQRSSSSRAVRW